MISYLNDIQSNGLCHPVIRDKADPIRKLLLNIESEHNTKQYKSKEYPWYEDNPNNYTMSLPIESKFGNLEMIVQSNSSLNHYWQHPNGKWKKSETFAKGVTERPVFFEDSSGHFVVVCKLENGGIGFWKRDNNSPGHPWNGPFVFQLKDVEPIMGSQFQDGRNIIVFKGDNQYFYCELDNGKYGRSLE